MAKRKWRKDRGQGWRENWRKRTNENTIEERGFGVIKAFAIHSLYGGWSKGQQTKNQKEEEEKEEWLNRIMVIAYLYSGSILNNMIS